MLWLQPFFAACQKMLLWAEPITPSVGQVLVVESFAARLFWVDVMHMCGKRLKTSTQNM